jgi:hypothetical protein
MDPYMLGRCAVRLQLLAPHILAVEAGEDDLDWPSLWKDTTEALFFGARNLQIPSNDMENWINRVKTWAREARSNWRTRGQMDYGEIETIRRVFEKLVGEGFERTQRGGTNVEGGTINIGNYMTGGTIHGPQVNTVGSQPTASVTVHNMSSSVKIDAGELRTALEELYDSLDQIELPRATTRSAQTATGNALDAVSEDEVKSETVVENVKKVGDSLKQANMAVREGSAMWQNVQELARLVGPLVAGGTGEVASWFEHL